MSNINFLKSKIARLDQQLIGETDTGIRRRILEDKHTVARKLARLEFEQKRKLLMRDIEGAY